MRAVKRPSPPALHHVPVTSAVGGSQPLICCLELAGSGLASVKPLTDKIQVLSALSPRFFHMTNGLFCLRHGDDCWQMHADIHVRVCRGGNKTFLNVHTNTNTGSHILYICPHHFLQAKHRRCMTCLQLDAGCCAPRQFLECVTDDVCVAAESVPGMAHGCGLQEVFPHNTRQTVPLKMVKG